MSVHSRLLTEKQSTARTQRAFSRYERTEHPLNELTDRALSGRRFIMDTGIGPVRLNGTGDWAIWIAMLERSAHATDVWQFIDPTVENPPQIPQPSFIIEETSADRFENEMRYDEYKARRTAIEDIRQLVETTVQLCHRQIITRGRTVHEILGELYKRFAPSEEEQRAVLQRQYDTLRQSTPNRRNIDKWIAEWETMYYKCEAVDLFKIDPHAPTKHFLASLAHAGEQWAPIELAILVREPISAWPCLPELIRRFNLFRNVIQPPPGSSRKPQATTFAAQYSHSGYLD
ncbi:hypothetical protein BDY21DRAFT_79379 [Lineolata rhizophorae]|uniref:Uncharacterized protein n=1 Tax=Lineolata rhizophorae TaxID=578093 RepID=A0A6A6NTQ1_9PEZI|nr:hypothetical protein BDY21DRAFT_79379 [Lineolata rhizophorae]